jgi:hypothetical protein
MAGKEDKYDSLANLVFKLTMALSALAIGSAFVWTML